MRITICIFTILILLIFTLVLIFSQTNTGLKVNIAGFNFAQYPTIRAYVSVTDDNGESILGLKKENFNIVSDGVALANFKLTSIFPDKEWLSIILAIDCSGSMRGNPFDNAKKAAIDFIARSGKNDRIQIMSFHTKIHFHSELIADKEELVDTIKSINIGKDTALYNAVSAAVEKSRSIEAPRKAIIILSDGKNTIWNVSEEESLKSAEKSGIPIYTVGLGKNINREYLELLTSRSGGYSFFTSDPEELIRLYQAIARQLQNQYVIIYDLSDIKFKALHQFEVMVDYNEMKAKQKKLFSPFIKGKRPGIEEEKTEIEPSTISKIEMINLNFLLLFALCGGILGVIVAVVIVSVMRESFSQMKKTRLLVYVLCVLFFTLLGILLAIL